MHGFKAGVDSAFARWWHFLSALRHFLILLVHLGEFSVEIQFGAFAVMDAALPTVHHVLANSRNDGSVPENALSVPEIAVEPPLFPPAPPSVAVGGVIVSRYRKRQQLPVQSQLEASQASLATFITGSRRSRRNMLNGSTLYEILRFLLTQVLPFWRSIFKRLTSAFLTRDTPLTTESWELLPGPVGSVHSKESLPPAALRADPGADQEFSPLRRGTLPFDEMAERYGCSPFESSRSSVLHLPGRPTLTSSTPSTRPRPANWSLGTSRATTLHTFEHRSSLGARSAPLQPLTAVRSEGGFCRPPPKPKPSPSARGAYAMYPSLNTSGSAAQDLQATCTSSKSGALHPAQPLVIYCCLRRFDRGHPQVSGPSFSTCPRLHRDESQRYSTRQYIQDSGSRHYMCSVSFIF